MAAHGPPMLRVVHVGEVNSAAACGLVCLVRDDWRGRGLSLNVVKERALNGFTVSQFHSFTFAGHHAHYTLLCVGGPTDR